MTRFGSKLFVEISKDSIVQKTGSKGRSKDFIVSRNNKLIHRYYYHVRILKLGYNEVFAALCKEFDLSHVRIAEIISDEAARLRKLQEAKLTRAHLKKMFPYFCWNDKPAEPYRPISKETYNGY